MRESDFLQENTHVLSLLKRIEKLKSFSDDNLKSLLKVGKIREYNPSEDIITRGDADRWVYVLISGEVEIVRDNNTIANLRRSGDMFGEMSAIDGSPRTAKVWAKTKTMVLGIDFSLLDTKEGRDNLALFYTMYRLFSEILAERLKATTEGMVKLQKELKKKDEIIKSLNEEEKTLYL